MKNNKINVCLTYSLRILQNEAFKKQLNDIDIVILPEMILGGYGIFKEDPKFFITKNEPFINTLVEYTKNHDILLLPGTFPIGNTYEDRKNVSLTMHKGKIINEYTKIHLFKPLNEHKLFLPGEYSKNFSVKIKGVNIRFGNIICFDLRFPELARKRTKEGLDILFVQAWWPKERDAVWKTLLNARAIENQIFVVGINSKNDPRCGSSYVFDPFGNLVDFNSKKKNYEILSLDLSKIKEVKKIFNNIDSAKILHEFCK
jgi:predicted amidohydrolase